MEDEKEIFFLRSDERVLQFIDISKANTIDDARNFIQKINDLIHHNESIYWAISLKESPVLIGTICLWNIVKENNTAEIGYALHPDFQGKGIMQEAIIKVIDYGFNAMQLEVIEADLDPANSRSIKLLERNGFTYKCPSEDLIVYSLMKPGVDINR